MKQQTSITVVQDFIKKHTDLREYNIETTNAGVSTDVFKLTSKNITLFLRLSDPTENMSPEALAHELLLKQGVKVPRVLAYEDFNSYLNCSYMITSEIEGTSTRFDKTNIKQVITDAGRQLALINQIPVEKFGWMDRETPNMSKLSGVYNSWPEFALDFELIEEKLDNLIKIDFFSKPLKTAYLNYLHTNQNLIICDQACLAHGDFALDHIYVKNGNYSGIIDLGDIRATSIYHDLGHFYIYASECFDDLLKGYLEVKPLDGGYREKIEFEAMLIALGKISWVAKYIPGNIDKSRNDFKLIHKVLA